MDQHDRTAGPIRAWARAVRFAEVLDSPAVELAAEGPGAAQGLMADHE
jgi:hypothetical protein